MDVPVTGSAGVLSENGVNALGGVGHLRSVAGFALHFGHLRRMREILDGGVAVGASKSSMHVRGMLVRTDGNAFAVFGFHVRLAVTGEAGFSCWRASAGFERNARRRRKRETTFLDGNPLDELRGFSAYTAIPG